MAKRNRGRRNNGQSQPQLPQNQSLASPSSPSGTLSTTQAKGNNTAAQRSENQHADNQVPPPSQYPRFSEGDTTEIYEDGEDGFQIVTNRRRAVGSRIQQRALHTPDHIEQFSPTMSPRSFRQLDGHLDYLFARLDDAIEDDRLDFWGIMAEIDRLLGYSLTSGRRWSTATPARPVESDDDDSDYLGSDDVPPSGGGTAGRGESIPLEISVDDMEHFPALGSGGGRRPAHSGAESRQNSRASATQALRNPLPSTQLIPRIPITDHSGQNLNRQRQSEARLPRNSPSTCKVAPPSPVATIPTLARAPEARPEPLNLKGLAEDASALLEVYIKSNNNYNQDENRQLIESAFENISKVRRHYRVSATQHGKPQNAPEEDNDEVKIDAGCIICYTEVADILLVPCNHLVLCTACCDMMGIQGKEKGKVWGGKPIPCPICRADIVDRIKVFRCS